MRLEIFDSYNIRARLCPSIILLSPLALMIYLCFENLFNVMSSSVVLVLILAFTNYLPIIQRAVSKPDMVPDGYAASLLRFDNTEIDKITKNRYYSKLSSLDPSFACFCTPDSSDYFLDCCKSAVIYLRNNTRDNHLVLEENISYGFCKNMLSFKPAGIIINIVLAVITSFYSLNPTWSLQDVSTRNWISFGIIIFFILFWLFGVNKKMVEKSAKRYAHTLIAAIDSLKKSSN